MVLLRASGVARVFGDVKIFEGVDVEVNAGDRLALIGENGSGKSTLFRVLAGLDLPDAGTVTRAGRLALLTQQANLKVERVVEAVTPLELARAQVAFERASEHLASGSDEALMAFAETEEQYRTLGGYDFEARANAVLNGLGLEATSRTDQLSGGQVRRVMLARLLLSPADVYLLDEPTNHLDLDGAKWLEGWIQASGAAFVLASHDRALLDAVATETAELERGKLTLYPGNYSAAMELKATLRDAQQRDYEAYKRKKAALEAEHGRLKSAGQSADKFSHRRAGNVPLLQAKNKAQDVANTLAGRAKAMERRLERLDAQAVGKPFQDRRVVRLDLPAAPLGAAEVLTVKNLSMARDGHFLLDGVKLHVRRGDRIALTGPNGSGKSTLLAALLGQLPYAGEVKWGAGLTVYATGQHGEELRGLSTVGEALLDANATLTPHQLFEVAAQVHLPGPTFRLADLSGGQRTRLSLARLGVTRAQVLVLDEPTNHLDIRMIEALEELLVNFSGTVLLASHDRRLVEQVATRVWAVSEGTIEEHPG